MSDSAEHNVEPNGDVDGLESNSLMSQLKVIEDQPLESRAAAFVQVHDRLQRRLEGGDSPASHG
ncbi:MAG: hypothetical protein ACOH10_11140 [Rhodoglobus sp.]